MRVRIGVTALALVLFVATLGGVVAQESGFATPAADSPYPRVQLSLVGTYKTGVFNKGAAEIVAHDPQSQRLFVVNGGANAIDILNVAVPSTPVLSSTIVLSPTYGLAANSVAVMNGVVAAAVEAQVRTAPGKLVFFNHDGAFLNQVTIGSLPDMVTFSPDGKYVLVANEGEPNSYGQPTSVDPEGSVSIVDISNGVANATVRAVSFADFNTGGLRAAELPTGVRIFGPGASVAQDLEPEYIAISPDSTTAFVTLQENNALAIVDIANARVTTIKALGTKNHNLATNALDPSDRDGANNAGAINIKPQPVLGMYQPDAIAAYRTGGQTYLVTANEGDARDYLGFTEEIRVGASGFVLDTSVFTNATALKTNAELGRLTVSRVDGDAGADGDFDAIYAYGARSFSIWNAATGALVFDSGDDIEQMTAVLYPTAFNSSHDSNSSFDTRSDNKGPEPEGVALGNINGRSYAFIGLERIGGVMMYDVSTPTAPVFIQYVNNRVFSGDAEAGTAGDLGPEGLAFVSASSSPNGKPLLLVANEISGSTSIYSIDSREQFLPTVFR